MQGTNRRAEKEKSRIRTKIQQYRYTRRWEMFRKGLKVGGLKRNEEHQQPEVSQKIDLSKYDAYYVDPKCTEKKDLSDV